MDGVKIESVAKFFNIPVRLAGNVLVARGHALGIAVVCGEYVSESVYDELMVVDAELHSLEYDKGEILERAGITVPFKQGPFVYFLIDGEAIVYIGQSVQLLSRINTHLQNGKQFDKVAVYNVKALGMIDIEAMNIFKYLPFYNAAVLNYELYYRLVLKKCLFN